jgi:hypothetical protein
VIKPEAQAVLDAAIEWRRLYHTPMCNQTERINRQSREGLDLAIQAYESTLKAKPSIEELGTAVIDATEHERQCALKIVHLNTDNGAIQGEAYEKLNDARKKTDEALAALAATKVPKPPTAYEQVCARLELTEAVTLAASHYADHVDIREGKALLDALDAWRKAAWESAAWK